MTTVDDVVQKELYRVRTADGTQVWKAAFTCEGQRYELEAEWPLDQKLSAEEALNATVYDVLLERSGAPDALPPGTREAPVDELPPPDPLTPFNTLGGPDPAPARRPTAEQLELASAHLNSFYPEGLVQSTSKTSRTLDVSGRVRKAFAALSRREWHILSDGSLVIAGGTDGAWYQVTDDSCHHVAPQRATAPDPTNPRAWALMHQAGKKGGRMQKTCKGFFSFAGMCYHAVARELLRLAQALSWRQSFAAVDARMLSGLFFTAALTSQPVILQVLPSGLAINAGGSEMLLPADTDGALTPTLEVPTERFAELWDAFAPIARTLANTRNSTTAEVWLNPAARQVNIFVNDVDFSYQLSA